MDEFANKTILGVAAHPDDLDFSSSGTIAKAIKQGAKVIYLLATKGQKGGNDPNVSSKQLAVIREREQRRAAKSLGVSEVHFLEFMDGELTPTLKLKERIVYFIRKFKPDIVITMDPVHFYNKDFGFINHSDHRAIGQATLDAVYPLARDLLSFPAQVKKGLAPHKVRELLITDFESPNYIVDITDTIDQKLKALSFHKSQIKDMSQVSERIKERSRMLGAKHGYEYCEAFVKLVLPR